MKILKAIEILQDLTRYAYQATGPDAADAIKLGIEALHRCQELSKYTVQANYMPLPGETQD